MKTHYRYLDRLKICKSKNDIFRDHEIILSNIPTNEFDAKIFIEFILHTLFYRNYFVKYFIFMVIWHQITISNDLSFKSNTI